MSFPQSLDSITVPQAGQPMNNPSQSGTHAAQIAAILAFEAKLGINGSAVAASIDYLLKSALSLDPGHYHTIAAINGLQAALDATGNVYGPSSATDHAIARFDLTTGKLLEDSSITISDAGAIYMHGADLFLGDGNQTGGADLWAEGGGIIMGNGSGSGGSVIAVDGGNIRMATSLGGGGTFYLDGGQIDTRGGIITDSVHNYINFVYPIVVGGVSVTTQSANLYSAYIENGIYDGSGYEAFNSNSRRLGPRTE